LVLAACAHEGPTPPPAEAVAAPVASPPPAPAPAPHNEDLAPLPVPANGPVERGKATFYSDRFAGRHTASGDRYDPQAMTAAHRTLPFGAVVDVSRADGRHVQVRINDRGPFGRRDRIIDLSRRAARELGIGGVAEVTLHVVQLPPKDKNVKGAKARKRTNPS
jgi:rare lipoprotein A